MFKIAQIYTTAIILTLITISWKKDDFHNSRIKGIIEKLSYSIGKQSNSKYYTILKINNKEYKLIITSAPMNEFSFMDVARYGDTVFKARYSDTIFVKRAGFNGGVRFPFIAKEYMSK